MNKPQEESLKEKKKQLNVYARFSAIGIQMGAIIAIGTFIGLKLDKNYPNSHKVYTLIFTLSAVIISIIYVIRRIIALSKDDDK